MKYFVQVNRNMMVSMTAESALAAEHAVLDLDGVQYANAFDDELINTEAFRGALLGCNTVSVDELSQMSKDYAKAWVDVSNAKELMETELREVERIEEMLRRQKADAAAAVREYNIKYSHAKTMNNVMNIEDC